MDRLLYRLAPSLFRQSKKLGKKNRERDLSDRLITDDRTFFWTPGISYVTLPNTLLVMVTIIEPLNCYVILPRTLLVMVTIIEPLNCYVILPNTLLVMVTIIEPLNCYVILPNTLLVMVTIIEPLNCYVILPRTLSLSLMVKLLLGSQGMLPIPVPAKVFVVVSRKIVRRQGTILSIFYLHIYAKQGIQRKNLMSLLVSYFAFQLNRKFASSAIS